MARGHILMQGLEFHQGDSSTSAPAETIWLVSGTGDGPPLAQALLQQGWNVLVSVVSASATRAYRSHPNLRFQVGQLQEDAEVDQLLRTLRPRWVLDASHPFAAVISGRLQRRCQALNHPLLRLQRETPGLPGGTRIQSIQLLEDLDSIALGESGCFWPSARDTSRRLCATAPLRSISREFSTTRKVCVLP